jgi:hypothetical protein
MRWASACRILAAELTPAAFGAWLRPLTPVALVPDTGPRPMPAGAGQGVHPHPRADSGADRHVEAAPGPGGQRLVLACNNAFHRDHVLRRYRAAIERAAGAACEVVVRPRG